MKLFAIAATTAGVNAGTVFDKYQPYRYQRVGPSDFPGPGHINEQGGYWADQPTVQSNSYVQPGQPGLPQPAHQQQEKQCCYELKFNDHNAGDEIVFTQSGMRDSKPMYTGVNQRTGERSMMFWSFAETTFTVPQQYIPGIWVIGAAGPGGFVEIAKSNETKGLSSCPDSQENGSNQSNGWDMRCNRRDGPNPPIPPVKVETCEDNNLANTNSGVWITLGDESECDMRKLLDQVVEQQFIQFKQFSPNSLTGQENMFWSDAKHAYREMLRIDDNSGAPHCGGSITVLPTNTDIKYSNDCSNICRYIGEMTVPSAQQNFNKVLDEFVKHVIKIFPQSLLNESMTAEPVARSDCAKHQTFFFRAIKDMEASVGAKIPSLPAGKWGETVNPWDRSLEN